MKSIFIHDFAKTIVNFSVGLLWFCLNICIILTGGVEAVLSILDSVTKVNAYSCHHTCKITAV